MDRGTVCVTGCAGFIGSHTTERLLDSDWRVVGVDDFSTGALENLRQCLNHSNFVLCRGDLAAAGVAEQILAQHRPNVVLHLAGLVDVKLAEDDPQRNRRLNVETTAEIGEAAVRNGVQRIVFASSAAVYGDLNESTASERSELFPLGNYGLAKLEGEQLLQRISERTSLEVVSLRYFNVFGPRQRPSSSYAGVVTAFLNQFREGAPAIIFGDGRQTRDFISVEDVARANSLAVSLPGLKSLTANICTGRSHSLIDVIRVFRRAFPQAPPAVFKPGRCKDIRHSCGNPELAATALGFRPAISFEQGLLSLARYEAGDPLVTL